MTDGGNSGQGAAAAHLDSLQYLRGIAAMMVVYYHAAVQIDQVTGLTTLPMAGSSGVDIFFVLSGFVMWWTTRGRDPEAGDFLLKRFIRIAPLYWVFTLSAGAIALFLPHLLRSTRFDALHVLTSLSFVPWWNPLVPRDDPIALTPIIVPGWTLNIEIAFYVLFAVTLRVREAARPYLLALLLAALFLSARTIFAGTPMQFYGTDLLAEFMAGVILAKCLSYIPVKRAGRWALLLAVSFAALLWFDANRPALPQSISLGIPAFLCVVSAVQIERCGSLRRSRLLSLLGDASYSIYISHVFVIPGMRLIWGRVGLDMAIGEGALFVAVTMLAAAIFGIVVHLMLERPLLSGVNRIVRGRRQPPAAQEFARR